MILKQNILKYMNEQTYKPMKYSDLFKELNISKEQEREFKQVFESLIEQGEVVKTRFNRYGLPHRMNLVVGKLQGNQAGFAFLISSKEENDTFIAPPNLNGAMHGDKVIARIITSSGRKKNKEGEVIRIIERARTEVVGRLEIVNKSYGFVVPDNSRIATDFYIAARNFNKAKNGEKVAAKVVAWAKKGRSPEAEIIKVFGEEGALAVEVDAVIHEYSLHSEFSENVLSEAQRVANDRIILGNRTDFRDKFTITIDGADARDFDDAITLEKKNNNYYLGVHIADVGHYVKKGSLLDKEALERTSSVYFPDRVLPMLPKILSNGVCSLNPQLDRYTLSVVMEINSKGEVIDHVIKEGLINSDQRLTYDLVNKLIIDKDIKLREEYHNCLPILEAAKELATILIEKRQKRGSIDFDVAESEIIVDQSDGKPIEIRPRERTFSDRIIEEFMLSANSVIAQHFYWIDIPFIYRVHGDPLPENIQELEKFLQNFNIYLKGINDGEIHPKELQQAVAQVEGKPEEKLINTVVLRSMQRAVYSASCDGHFGLSLEYYTHFTAPIRRYPDLAIHRIIKEYIKQQLDVSAENESLAEYVSMVANQATANERNVDEAERSIIDLLKVEYISGHLYEEYTGIISGVIPSGFFVELANTVEGFVHVSSLYDDYYVFQEENYRFLGERTGKAYRIGDKVDIKVMKADIKTRRVDFVLTELEK